MHKGSHNLELKRSLFPLLKKEKRSIIAISSCLLMVMVISAFLPLVSAKIIDEGFINYNLHHIIKYSALLMLMTVCIYALYYICEDIRLKANKRISFSLKEKASKKLLSIEIDYYSQKNAAEIFQKIDNDIKTIAGIFSSTSILSLMQIVLSIGYIVVLSIINWKLTLLVVSFIPVKFFLTLIISKKNVRVSSDLKNAETAFSAWLGDMINGMREVRIFNLAAWFSSNFNKRQDAVLQSEYQQGKLSNINQTLQITLVNTIVTVLYIVSGFIVNDGSLSVGEVIAVQTYSLTTLDFVSNFLDLIYGFSSLIPSLSRFNAFINYPSESNGGTEKITSLEISFIHVCFGYKNSEEVVHDFNATIKPGKKYAIIGANGSGKTTLMNLLLRFYSPTDGAIKIGDKNIREIPLEQYRNQFSVVSQDCFLMNDTIINNVVLNQDYDINVLSDVFETVQLTDFVSKKGTDYIIGNNGSMLSGGQKQKIALARAIISDRPIVILDEATSNIDKGWSEIIQTLIKKQFKDKTVIIITHKKEVLEYVDEQFLLSRTTGVRNENCNN